jgi:radical SAM superfamily enzyme YgiQ (UPF0313 family)
MKVDKILLLFPPVWTPFSPPCLGLPSLTAYCNDHGYSTDQLDVSIEVFDIMMSKKYLEEFYTEIDEHLSRLENQPTVKESRPKHDELVLSRSILESAIEQVESVKALYRSDDEPIEVINRRVAGCRLLDYLFQALSAPYYPTRVSIQAYNSRYMSDLKLHSLLLGVKDINENFYSRIFSEDMLPRILKYNADIVGLSLSGISQLLPCLTLADLIKSADPSAKIVLGGALIPYMGPSLSMPELFSVIDMVVMGEGEHCLVSIADAMENNSDLEGLPNLIFKDKQGKIKVTEKEYIEDMNMLPTPSFDGLDLCKYLVPEGCLPLLTSRGCYWDRCSFCSLCSSYLNRYRERAMGSVIQDIKTLIKKYGLTYVIFNDEVLSPHRINALSKALLDSGVNIYWRGLARFEGSFDQEIFRKAYESGCREMSFGLESASPRILEAMNKGISVETAQKVLKQCHDAGIWTGVFVLFGFPGETSEDANESIKFFETNHDIIDSMETNILKIEQGSRLFRNASELGISIKEDQRDYYLIYNEREYYIEKGGPYQGEAQKSLDLCTERLQKLPLWKIRLRIFANEMYFRYAVRYGRDNVRTFLSTT